MILTNDEGAVPCDRDPADSVAAAIVDGPAGYVELQDVVIEELARTRTRVP
jgi:hypothetical protein